MHHDDRPPAGVKVAEAAGIVRQNVGLICQSTLLESEAFPRLRELVPESRSVITQPRKSLFRGLCTL